MAMTVEDQRGQDDGTALAALERFVVDNDDLLKLESQIGRFNIFDALRIARAEIRHSNFLAFILDPSESHGQGSLFLKPLLMDLLKSAPADSRPISPIDLDGADLRGIEIRREWNHIDLLIACNEPRFFVVIENKVGSGEHSNQLRKYQGVMQKHYPEDRPLYVFLTPDGDEPSSDLWRPYTYEDVHRVLQRTRDIAKTAIGDEVLVFLDHYLNLLRTRFMNDDKLDGLCRKIYKNHRRALDIIWERAGGFESQILDEVAVLLEGDERWDVLQISDKYIDCMPKGWSEWLPPSAEGYNFCIHLRLHKFSNFRLTCVPLVGPMENQSLRQKVVATLREKSPDCGFKKTTGSAVEGWNRISRRETLLEWEEGSELEPDEIRRGLKPKFDTLFANLEKLAQIFRPLCEA
ncbi:MAG: PD-(D/E)XK nuclease family protein [Planctomycetaceae bacterium]